MGLFHSQHINSTLDNGPITFTNLEWGGNMLGQGPTGHYRPKNFISQRLDART